MSRDNYAQDVIEDRLLGSVQTMHALWLALAQRFADRLMRAFQSFGWSAQLMGYRDLTAFGLLLERDAGGNGWFLRIHDAVRQPKWLLWFGYATDEMTAIVGETRPAYPSIFFSVRDPQPNAVHPYVWVSGGGVPREVTIRPLEHHAVIIRERYSADEVDIDVAATRIARALISY
jgi:hypothetical protein